MRVFIDLDDEPTQLLREMAEQGLRSPTAQAKWLVLEGLAGYRASVFYGLESRIALVLMRGGVTSAEEVARMTDEELRKIPWLGGKVLQAIRNVIPYVGVEKVQSTPQPSSNGHRSPIRAARAPAPALD